MRHEKYDEEKLANVFRTFQISNSVSKILALYTISVTLLVVWEDKFKNFSYYTEIHGPNVFHIDYMNDEENSIMYFISNWTENNIKKNVWTTDF